MKEEVITAKKDLQATNTELKSKQKLLANVRQECKGAEEIKRDWDQL